MSAVQERLNDWKKLLLDLSRRNRLLNFRETKRQSVRVDQPSAQKLFDRLVGQEKQLQVVGLDPETALLALELEDDPDSPKREVQVPPVRAGEVRFAGTPEAVAKALYTLRQRGNTELEERGVGVLFLAIGFLTWYEADQSDQSFRSPLILLPVNLVRESAKGGYSVWPSDDDIEFNPTLAKALQEQYRIRLPEPGDEDDLDLGAYFDRVRAAIKRQSRWTVDDSVYLSVFSFLKLNMFKDLEGAGRAAEENPVIAALAGDIELLAAEQEKWEEIPIDELDARVRPEDCMQVLDADASQQQAIELAKAGASFVLQGPPGTGKSQTIANIIAEVLGTGRTVLFVSEKAAALDVVHRRLCQTQLGEHCLPLHSHRANKREVVQELARTFSKGPQSALVESQFDFETLRRRRETLNVYVRELHLPRQPLGRSIFDAQAQYLQLQDAPHVELAISNPLCSAENNLVDMRDAMARLSANSALLAREQPSLWQGLRPEGADDVSVAWIEEPLRSVRLLLATVLGELDSLEQALVMPAKRDAANGRRLIDMARHWTSAPPVVPSWLQADDRTEALQLTKWAQEQWEQVQTERNAVEALFVPAFLEYELDGLQSRLSAAYAGAFKRLGGAYRSEIKALKPLTPNASKPAYSDLVAVTPTAILLRDRLKGLEERRRELREKLGSMYAGEATDWPALAAALKWSASLQKSLGNLIDETLITAFGTAIDDRDGLKKQTDTADAALKEALESLSDLQAYFDEDTEFSVLCRDGALTEAAERIDLMLEDLNEVPGWLRLRAAIDACSSAGVTDVLGAFRGKGVSQRDYVDALSRRFLEVWLQGQIAQIPELRDFEETTQEYVLEEFRKLDLAQISFAQRRLARQIASNRPNPRAADLKLQSSQAAKLMREAKKQRRHMPLRKLFEEIPELLIRLKPCLMMSPLSVSQFLKLETASVDLVIFDEASQVKPEDAVGAILRGKQLIVVGDSKQLPPTSFFDATTSDDDWDEADDFGDVSAFESILDVCGTIIPERMLEWHYRSRHEGLIAFSNHFLYNGRLTTFPGPGFDGTGTGVSHVYVPDGVYDRGGTRTNRREVEEIVKLVVRHYKESPDKTLGVVAFSEAQMSAIDAALWRLRSEDARLEALISQESREPLFIKNLENVQGDERDVIIFSIGYARDGAGNLTLNFGPLNRQGGERRLNVAVSRAREAVIVVSSIRGADLGLQDTAPEGARLLKNYLDYAERGTSLLDEYTTADPFVEADSPFEEDVQRVIEGLGYEVHRQVGCSGYRIDLAIVHPEFPGRYVLGVECDGATYHSAATARERDRLREQVLRGLGWQILRIWSTDWVKRRAEQVERLRAAIERAIDEYTEGRPAPPMAEPKPIPESDLLTEVDPVPVQPEIPVYRRAELSRQYGDFYESRLRVQDTLIAVVEQEGPVRADVAIRRTAAAWGIFRTGAIVKQTGERAIADAKRSGVIQVKNGFLWPREMTMPSVRRSGTGAVARKIDEICKEEIAEAAYLALQDHMVLTREDLAVATARNLGFDRVGALVADGIAAGITLLIRQKRARVNGDKMIELA